MTDPTRHADALLTDHFTYTPLSLIDDIINAVNTIIYQALDAIEDGLLNVPPTQLGFKASNPSSEVNAPDEIAAEAARNEIENGVHQLETLLESTVDKSFDKFEIWTLRNILTVPEDLDKWIQLSHYKGLELSSSDLTTTTPESIHALRRQLAETQKLNTALQSQHARNASLLTQLHAVLSPPTTSPTSTSTSNGNSLAFLNPHSSSTTGSTPLTTQSQFATSQLPALRQLVAELRPKLGKLKDLDPSEMVREKRKEERRTYIEGGVRRVVDRGGISARGEGDLKAEDGERRGREEVEGLEGVVKGLK